MIHVIGAGIAGLYAGYRLKALGYRVTIHESNEIGGRVGMTRFAGTLVPTGAGIGRKSKDALLLALCAELRVPVREFTTRTNYKVARVVNVAATARVLRDALRTARRAANWASYRATTTFGQFAARVLGLEEYRAFVETTGFSDFEDADIVDTVCEYGFEDVVPGYTAFVPDWARLVRRLRAALDGCIVPGRFTRRDMNAADTYIIATAIDSVRALLPTSACFLGVAPQPFVRLYFTCDVDLACGFTVCTGLQKIIQMSGGPHRAVYMIYSDNDAARAIVAEVGAGTIEGYVERWISALFRRRVRVGETRLVYWPCGTHYYTPLDARFASRDEHIAAMQAPERNVFVVGEAVSKHQGWCEGALESVESLLANVGPRKILGGFRTSPV
jgi:hypothetical protein